LHGRDHLHGSYLDPVGAAAGGRVRLRFGDDVLAAVCRVGPRGVFERLQEVLLGELGAAGLLDRSRVSVDSFSLRAVRGDHTGANPADRAKPGSKLHLANEGTGLPLSLLVTAANLPDAAVFEALLDDIPKVRTPAGGRRCRLDKCHADKAFDNRRCRGHLTRRGIKVRIARRGVESSTRLGRHRWKAERTIAWLAGCRRLRIRYDRDSERALSS
jgi:transposase